MKTQLIVPVLGLAFLLCAACGGGAHKRPALQHPVTPPQEYRQETSGPNNPGSLFAASEEDTLFADSRARRVGDIVVVKLVENTKAQNKAETTGQQGRLQRLPGRRHVRQKQDRLCAPGGHRPTGPRGHAGC